MSAAANRTITQVLSFDLSTLANQFRISPAAIGSLEAVSKAGSASLRPHTAFAKHNNGLIRRS